MLSLPMVRRLPIPCIVATVVASFCSARPAFADTQAIFKASMEDTVQGAQGQTPTSANGVTFVDGVVGRAASFGEGNQLYYPASGNIDSREGTLMFWMRSHGSLNDGQTHTIARYGSGGGMVFSKDGANNLRIIVNRYGDGAPEMGVDVNVSNWAAGQWRLLAFTWSASASQLCIFVDGTLLARTTTRSPFNLVTSPTFQIGADGDSQDADADIDELEISGVARSEQEIHAAYLARSNAESLAIMPPSADMRVSQTIHPTLTIMGASHPPTAVASGTASWASSDQSVASVDPDGTIHALHIGSSTITAAVGSLGASLHVAVTDPNRPPEIQDIDPYLATAPAGSLFDMPVAIIRYIATKDGLNVDTDNTGWGGTVTALIDRIDQLDIETKFMLQEMSRFRGYKDPSSTPALGYRVVKIINVFEPFPLDKNPAHRAGTPPDSYYPDYNAIMNRFDGRHLVEDLGVKEIWLWGGPKGTYIAAESNMSSPATGDISNSYRFPDDLPIYGRTYTLYNYNYGLSSSESVHDHGHQLEAILGYTARRQDGNDRLFWRDFVGRDAKDKPITGRCGNTHIPPNTTVDYDYWNTTPVLTDIEDWRPDGSGAKKMESAATWGAIPYQWPYGRVPDDTMQHNWYIYWGQAMPGWNNVIPYNTNRMTNWWMYTGDWDAATSMLGTACGLYASGNTTPPTVGAPAGIASVAAGEWLDLSVTATGPGSLAYQWRKAGRPLVDGGRIQGARTSHLRVRTEGLMDSGGYDVVVTSGHGMVSSPVKTVSVAPALPDAARALRIGSGLITATAVETDRMDSDRDHRVDMRDALRLLRSACGL